MCLEDKGLLQFQAVFKQMWVTHQVAEWEMGLVPQHWNKIVLLYQHCFDWWLLCALSAASTKWKSPQKEEAHEMISKLNLFIGAHLSGLQDFVRLMPWPRQDRNISFPKQLSHSAFSILSTNGPGKLFLSLIFVCLLLAAKGVSSSVAQEWFLWCFFWSVPGMQQVICCSNTTRWIYNT